MILLIDNYDSFTYNLYHLIAEIYPHIEVIRNDKATLAQIVKKDPKAIVISPGPKTPKEAGISVELIQKLGKTIPILGVCLGMQAMAYAYGGKVVRAPTCVHGKSDPIYHKKRGLFENVKLPFEGARYHSLVVDKNEIPRELAIEAHSSDGQIMALSHVKYPLWGVQFHPESILSEEGNSLMCNFLKMAQVI